MASAHNPATIRGWHWTSAEKTVARRAFDLALSGELEAVVRKAKERATRITEATELWELKDWLGGQRRRIDREFDYRYSVLIYVFANLLSSGRLTEDDLRGLAPDKLDAVRFLTRLR